MSSLKSLHSVKRNGSKITISRQHRERLVKAGHIPEDATQKQIDEWRAANGRMMTAGEAGHIYAVHRAAKMKAEARKSELDLMEREGAVVETSRVKAALDAHVARARAMMVAKMGNDLPAKLGGCPADQIALAYKVAIEEICAELAKPLV